MINLKKVSPGVRSFIIKTAVFVALLLFFKFLINHYPGEAPWIRATYLGEEGKPTDFKPYELISVVKAAIFLVIAFVLFNWETLKRLKKYRIRALDIIAFSLLSVFFYFFHYLYKYFLKINLDFANSFFIFFFIIKLGIMALCVLSLGVAVYGALLCIDFARQFRREIPLFIGVGVVFYFLIEIAGMLWFISSSAVTFLVSKMLSLHVPAVSYDLSGAVPVLYAKARNVMHVYIAKECSGIDGFLLFASIFFIIMYIERKDISIRRMLASFVPGAVIFFFYNVLRIYLLMVIGIYYNRDFAIDLFHDNIGWMLFLLYFVIFWHFASGFVYLKRNPIKKKGKKAKD